MCKVQRQLVEFRGRIAIFLVLIVSSTGTESRNTMAMFTTIAIELVFTSRDHLEMAGERGIGRREEVDSRDTEVKVTRAWHKRGTLGALG